MPLPTFKTREEIPDAFRSEYVERDGEWVPDVEDVGALKNAHERQKDEARVLKAKLKELEETAKAKASGVTDEQLAKLRADIAAEKAPVEEALAKAAAELRSLKLDAHVKKLMLDAGANPKRIDALFKLVGDRFDLNESGTPILKDKPTTTLAGYLKETIAAEYPELYVSPQLGGITAPGGTSGGTTREDLAKLVDTNPARLLQLANEKAA